MRQEHADEALRWIDPPRRSEAAVPTQGPDPSFSLELNVRRAMIIRDHKLSVRRQCQLLGLHRWSVYYQPAAPPHEDLEVMRLLDEEHTRLPF